MDIPEHKSQPAEHSNRVAQLVAAAWVDDQLKQRLVAEPASVLRERGIEVPSGIEVRVLEPPENVVYLVLPPKPANASELSVSELSGIVGGDITIRAGGSITLDENGKIIAVDTGPAPSGCYFCAFY
jgi:Nitrile hydratase, alpha chain